MNCKLSDGIYYKRGRENKVNVERIVSDPTIGGIYFHNQLLGGVWLLQDGSSGEAYFQHSEGSFSLGGPAERDGWKDELNKKGGHLTIVMNEPVVKV